MWQTVGKTFLNTIIPIYNRRIEQPYTLEERNKQLEVRAHYVEFNLLYDRGTLFGIQSGGRTESILMSLPPQVIWKYDWKPQEGSKEAELYRRFLVIKNWL